MPFAVSLDTFDAPSGSNIFSGTFSFDVTLYADRRYDLGLGSGCVVDFAATSVFVAGNGASCSATYSATGFGLSNIRDLDGNPVANFSLSESPFPPPPPPPPPPVGGVPEPASWTLLLAGFGISGAMLRRARRARPRGEVAAIAL